MPVPAEYVRSLHTYELQILLALERLMRRYRWVPLEVLKSATRFSESELSYRLGRLMAMDMVRYEKTPPYEGYALVFNGYDTLALHTLTRRGHRSGARDADRRREGVRGLRGDGPRRRRAEVPPGRTAVVPVRPRKARLHAGDRALPPGYSLRATRRRWSTTL